MKNRKALYLAAMEHELAVGAFAQAMRGADLQFIESHAPYAALPMTPNMESAAIRFVKACERLNKLNEKAQIARS